MNTKIYFKPGPVMLRTIEPEESTAPLPDEPMSQQVGRLLQQWNDQQDWVAIQCRRRKSDAVALVLFTMAVTLAAAAAGLLLRGTG